MSYTITKKELTPQQVVLGQRQVDRSGIAKAISEILPRAFRYAQERGLPISGPPLARYTRAEAGRMTIEPGIPVSLPENFDAGEASSEASKVRHETLPGGAAASTIHAGPYDTLMEAYAALESWMESNGFRPAGSPWESYLTDPGEHADPKDWRTEVIWPIA